MLKKIVLGTLFVGLVAVLVIGAANRTSARAESDSEVDHSAVTREASKGQGDGGRGLGARVMAVVVMKRAWPRRVR